MRFEWALASLALLLGCAPASRTARAPLIRQDQPPPRVIKTLRGLTPWALSEPEREALYTKIEPTLRGKRHAELITHRISVFTDDRKQRVMFVVYEHSPVMEWELELEASERLEQAFDTMDRATQACESKIPPNAADHEARLFACEVQAYPERLRPFLHEGQTCGTLHLARVDLGTLERPQATLVYDRPLLQTACDVGYEGEPTYAGDLDGEGRSELAFSMEWVASEAKAAEATRQSMFMIDASTGELQRRLDHEILVDGKVQDVSTARFASLWSEASNNRSWLAVHTFEYPAHCDFDSMYEAFDVVSKGETLSEPLRESLQDEGACHIFGRATTYHAYDPRGDRWSKASTPPKGKLTRRAMLRELIEAESTAD